MTYEVLKRENDVLNLKLFSRSNRVAKSEFTNMMKDLGIKEVVNFKWVKDPNNRHEAFLEIKFI